VEAEGNSNIVAGEERDLLKRSENQPERVLSRRHPFFAWIFLPIFLLFLVGSTADAFGPDPRPDVKRLLEEAPSLSSYPGKMAVVLSRHVSNRLLADGSMERTTRWVLLYKGLLPERWQTWTVAAPEGGSAGFAKAETYSVPAVNRIGSLEVSEFRDGGGKGASLKVPEAQEETVLLIETVQTFPRRFDLDDHVWVELDLPQWELRIDVEIPRGTKLNWAGAGVGQPERTQERGVERYSWTAKNLPAGQELSILDNGRPSLGFSLKGGLVSSLEALREVENGTMEIPKELKGLLSGRNPEKSGTLFLASLNNEANWDGRLPENWVRPASATSLREEEAKTEWESTLMARTGLKSIGWNVTTWWLPAIPVSENLPAGISQWTSPVLEVAPPGAGKTFLFKAGAASSPGRTPSPLIGATLYRLEGEKVIKTRVPEGSASGNRLSARWELALDEAGFANGKLWIQLRGGWDYLLRTKGKASPEKALGLVREMLASTPFLSGMGEPELSESGGGLQIRVPVRGLLGIASQKDLLVRFPATSLPGLKEILEETGRITLRFPFSIQQEYALSLPKGYHVLEPPASRGKSIGKITVEESFRYREKRDLVEAGQLVSITASRLDENGISALKDSLAQALRWGTNSIPLRKR
jgi:hypothetical protein